MRKNSYFSSDHAGLWKHYSPGLQFEPCDDPSSTMTDNNLSNNYFKITQETCLESLSVYCHILLSRRVFMVSGADSVVSYVLCGFHVIG